MLGRSGSFTRVSVFLPIALLCWLAGQSHAKDLCLVGGSVVNPANRTIIRADIIIKGTRIAKVVSVTSATRGQCDGKTLDISGGFVVPGFIDAHVHAWGNPSPITDLHDEEWGDAGTAQRTLSAGVVGILSMTGDREDVALRDKLHGSSKHAQIVLASPTYSGAANARAARERIAAMVKAKPDLIKLFAGGSQIQVMVQEAKRWGKKTVVHIATWDDADVAVKSGATAITHLEDEVDIPVALAQEMARRQTVAVPTMAVQCDMAALADPAQPPPWWSDPLLLSVTSAALRTDYQKAGDFSDRTLRTIRWQKAGCRTHDYASIKRLHAAGVRIIAGSDTGNLGTFQGFSLHREMELLVEAGLPTWDALAAGTTAAADFLALPFGVAEGSEASIVVLQGSPIRDIRNTRAIRYVIHHGQVVR